MKDEIAYFMRRLYERGLTTCSGGNLSWREEDGTVLITPSGLDKGRMTGEQIGEIAPDGTNLTPALKPSMETGMHLAIFAARPDVRAIVHAHPVTSTSFTASHREIRCDLIAEARAVLGSPVEASYALMGTPELARIVADRAQGTNVILMANHGVLTVGKTLLQAFDRIEVLEASARMTILTEVLGERRALTSDQMAEIDRLMK
jgi:L-fuculose-phosphate aldolase